MVLHEELKGKKVKHSEKGTYYTIKEISFFCSSTFPSLEGNAVVHYTDGAYPYSRFYGEFFGNNENGEPRFVILDGKTEEEVK